MSPRIRKIIFIIAVVLLGISGQQMSSESSPAKASKASHSPSQAQLSNRETAAAYIALMSTEPDHLYDVVRTVDGDTIVVKASVTVSASSTASAAATAGEKEITVRLLGIDTPETVDPRKAVQCFGKEVSAKTKELLAPHTPSSSSPVVLVKVRLAGDPSQTTTDKYNRLLAYVYRASDGLFINKYLIEQGYAHEYTYDVPYAHRDEFRLAERQAREAGQGLWSPQACK